MDVLDFPLSRLCYAAHPEDAAEVQRAGLEAWLGKQLDRKNTSSPELEARLRSYTLQIKYAAGDGQPSPAGDMRNWPAVDEMRPLRYLGQPIDTAWTLLDPKVTRPNEEDAARSRKWRRLRSSGPFIAARKFSSAWWDSGTIISTWPRSTARLAARYRLTTATRSARMHSAISASCSKRWRRALPC